jgi:hypothetical protein
MLASTFIVESSEDGTSLLMVNKIKLTRRRKATLTPSKIFWCDLLCDFGKKGKGHRHGLRRPPMRAAKKGYALPFLRQRGGYIFAFCVFLVFMQAGLFAGHRHQQLASYPGASSDTGRKWLPGTPSVFGFSSANTRLNGAIREHPIPRLMEEAEDNFKRKLSGQSRTIRGAVATYRSRYKRDPPRGFDEWWKFAQKHEVKMVDEYDGLMEDLAPFWELSGEELRRRALQVVLTFVPTLPYR